jgi:hypothetical protein
VLLLELGQIRINSNSYIKSIAYGVFRINNENLNETYFTIISIFTGYRF